MIRKLLLLLALIVAAPVMADCPCPDSPKPAKQPVRKATATFKKVADTSPCPESTSKHEYHGSWLLGAGPMVYKDFGDHSTKVGATAVVGYRLEHDFEFLIGPTWTPHSDITAVPAYGCPFKIEGRSPWGAQLLVVYEF